MNRIEVVKMKLGASVNRVLVSIVALTLVITMITPMSAMATEVTTNSKSLSFDTTKKIAAEKAKLLTEKYGITSVQYALIDHGEIVISGHTGKNDIKGEQPLTTETMYGIGSTSKMVLAAAVMKLVDQGKVDLDTPVVKYVPDFKMKDHRYKQITPRMLLNHSSGLHGYIGPNATLFNDNDTHAHDTLLEELEVQDLKADPGAFSVYNNVGFSLAEILVERVSGMSFTAFIHKYFTAPLDMKHTKTPQDHLDPAALAGTYHANYKGQLPTENYNVIASGGIYSTAEDIATFSRIFTGDADDILSSKSVTAMERAEYKKGMWSPDADSSLSYGLGWDSVSLFPFNQYGIKALTKGGDTAAYHSSLVVLPEYNMAAAVLSSGGVSAIDQLLAKELLLSALQEKGVIKEQKPEKSHGVPIKADMPQELSQHAGIYGGTSGSLLKVEMNPGGGELTVSTITAPNIPVRKYTYTADGSFVNEKGTEKYKFVVEKNGRTYLWSRSYLSISGLGQLAFSEYIAEKLEPNELVQDVLAIWKHRENKNYYLLSEKYSSMFYFNGGAVQQFQMSKDAPGYVLNNKILDANKAANKLQLPTMAGRDSMEINFFKKNGVEYFTLAGHLYGSEELVKPIYSGAQSTTTIQANGHAKWFAVPAAAKGKVMSVKMPANASFAVYDQAGICINYTVVSGKNEVLLPENGRIVFAGEAGSKFVITLKK
ncbi:beta-lactamase family protein [Paenibacillus sp. SC116]|uniref:serine hydrolase domain-containing protein n=1 Tax=Paenibacillus sp. SC116 TaxID=2968986 RepID=UPI00215B72E5|nr:serine hydrolase domain-containing protein [Paenibacillus sp. SC116]MCR8842619.1 beta-lactamase family protein [Paenibacillus sp. SC116]